MGRDPKEPNTTKLEQATGIAVEDLGFALMGYRDLMVDLEGFSVRAPLVRGGEFLATLRGTDHEGGPVVAFHTATTLDELVRGVAGRLASGQLKWRVDEYRR